MIKVRVLVTGAGGFIGHHLVKRLKAEGNWVRAVDIKTPEYEATAADEFELLDLRRYDNCLLGTRGQIDQVYNLAGFLDHDPLLQGGSALRGATRRRFNRSIN